MDDVPVPVRDPEDARPVLPELSDAVLETSTDAVVAIGPDGRVTGWNRASEELLGWSASEAVGASMADLIIPEEFREAHARGMERLRHTGRSRMTGRPLSLLARHRDGRRLPVEVSIWATDDAGHFHAFLRDVERRHAREHALERLRLRFLRLAELVPGAFVLLLHDPLRPGGYRCDFVSGGWSRLAVAGEPDPRDDVRGFFAAFGPDAVGRSLGTSLAAAQVDMHPLTVRLPLRTAPGREVTFVGVPVREAGELAWEALVLDLPPA